MANNLSSAEFVAVQEEFIALQQEYVEDPYMLLFSCAAETSFLLPGMQDTINDWVAGFVSGGKIGGVRENGLMYTFYPMQGSIFTDLDNDFGIGTDASNFEEKIRLHLGGQPWEIPPEETFRRRVHDYTRYVIYSVFNRNLIPWGFSKRLLNRLDRNIGSAVWEVSFVPGCTVRLIPFILKGRPPVNDAFGFRFVRTFEEG